MRKIILMILGISVVFSLFAEPVQWTVESGGNGHYYDVIDFPEGITWDVADTYASMLIYNGMYGHLATITSAEENDFILTNLGGGSELNTYWLGGFQSPDTDDWGWITGEPWQFTNWTTGEPNNNYGGDGIIPRPELAGTDEEVVQFWNTTGKWNDMEHSAGWGGLLVEYDSVQPQNCGDLGTVYVIGDLNKDCIVDLQDFALLAGTWMVCTEPNQLNCP